jgi:hypothetical protein
MAPSRSISHAAPSAVSVSTIVTSLLTVQTSGRGFVDLTAEIVQCVDEANAAEGQVSR